MSRHVRSRLAILALLALAIAGVARQLPHASRPHPAGGAVLRVTTDFYPTAEFARQIGGSAVSVTTLVPAGSEPHDFEPLPRDIATLEQSRVFVYNSASMDPWATRVLPDLQHDGVATIDASQGIARLPDPEVVGAATAAQSDPHVWLDPVLAKQEVDNIARGFIAADPRHRALYTANATAYKARLDRLDAAFRRGLASCASRDIVTSHAAFQYLARRYGLTQIAIAGLSPDEEPSPRKLAEISRFVQAHHVHAIFFEALVSPRLAQTVAGESGAQTLVLDPLESLTPDARARGANYLSVQLQNLHNLRQALGCR